MEKPYKIGIRCGNCGYRGTQQQPFGVSRPDVVTCPGCGCNASTEVESNKIGMSLS